MLTESATLKKNIVNARTLTRIRVLLNMDEGWKDKDIVDAFDICQAIVLDIYKHYIKGGLEAVLHDKVQQQ